MRGVPKQLHGQRCAGREQQPHSFLSEGLRSGSVGAGLTQQAPGGGTLSAVKMLQGHTGSLKVGHKMGSL
jgi:hypothetical protein